MVLLGDSPVPPVAKTEATPPSPDSDKNKGLGWAAKHGVTAEEIDEVFSKHGEELDVIANKAPGKSQRQQTVNAYLLAGVRALLKTGQASFSDADAREVCRKLGCYSQPNHSNYIKSFSNDFSGSREAGWRLTNPGLANAARVVKQIGGKIEKP